MTRCEGKVLYYMYSKNHDTIIQEYGATFELTGKAATTTAFPTGIVMTCAVFVPIAMNILPPSTLIYLPWWCKVGTPQIHEEIWVPKYVAPPLLFDFHAHGRVGSFIA